MNETPKQTPRSKYTTDYLDDDSTRIIPETLHSEPSEKSSSESNTYHHEGIAQITYHQNFPISNPVTPLQNRLKKSENEHFLNTNKSPTKILAAPNDQKLKPGGKMHCDIHGDIHLHPVSLALIDTPEFQRLRTTKQLGMASCVYATATHTRFEHCIGVNFLSVKFTRNLMSSWNPMSDIEILLKSLITETDLLCVQTAALIHDFGHGPWSHAWDSSIVIKEDRDSTIVNSTNFPQKWTHEIGSGKLLDYILKKRPNVAKIFKKFKLDKPENLSFIKELISEEKSVLEPEWPFKSRKETHAWLFEIVSNHRFGVDVDRLDYLMRDASKCGLEANCKNAMNRYLDDARINVHKDTGRPIITVPEKDRITLFNGVFKLRYKMHCTVYQHKTVKKIELMCRDMLLESKDILKDSWSNQNIPSLDLVHRNMEYYSIVTEGLLEGLIKFTEHHPEISNKYVKAREILKRIHERDLYRVISKTELIDARKIDGNRNEKQFLKHFEEELENWQEKAVNWQETPMKKTKRSLNDELSENRNFEDSEVNFLKSALSEKMFEVVKSKFDHGQGTDNPLKDLYYFSKEDGELEKSEYLDPSILPSCFRSVQFMLVYKGKDRISNSLKDKISELFTSYF